jgi:hypothetical protein
MREQGSGLIVNTSSVYGRTIMLGQGAYAGSKWALEEKGKLERTGAYEWFYRLFDPEKYDRRFIDRGVGYVQPEDVAEVVVEIAESDDRPKRRIVGPWKYAIWLGYVVPDGVRDALLQGLKRLP